PGIEADALAHDREVAIERVPLTLLAGPHDDHPGRVVTAPSDREEEVHPQLAGALGLDDVEPQAVLLREIARRVGKDLGADVVRAAVRERPGVVRALAHEEAPI